MSAQSFVDVDSEEDAEQPGADQLAPDSDDSEVDEDGASEIEESDPEEEEEEEETGTSGDVETPNKECSPETISEPPVVTSTKKQRYVSHCQYLRYRLRRRYRCKVNECFITVVWWHESLLHLNLQFAFHPVWSAPRIAQHYVMDNVIRIINQRLHHERLNHTQTLKSKK